MNANDIIDKYYTAQNPQLRDILITHSVLVKKKALSICDSHPELNADRAFVENGAMLHDVGIFLTDAPTIYCFGKEPYLRHGFLGAELMRREGYPEIAGVCERHTGAGLTAEAIEKESLPLPLRDFLPRTIEEQIICFADKFFSKTHLTKEKTPEMALRSLRRFGDDGMERFKHWMDIFL